MPEHHADRLQAAIKRCGTPAVVGLDPVIEKLPPDLQPRDKTAQAAADGIEAFCRGVIDVVAEQVPAVKPNIAFFEALYEPGVAAYRRVVAHAHERGLIVIGDIKRGDIGSTAKLYARGHLAPPTWGDVDPAGVPDAVTLAGYLGENAIRPFIDVAREHGRGVYVLVRPSEPKADEVHEFGTEDGRFYQHMARLVHLWGIADDLIGTSGLSCVGAVVAPKDTESTRALRSMLPQTPFLVPGYGAQGGTAESCRACFRDDRTGAVVNASRSVIYAYGDPTGSAARGDAWQEAVADACKAFAADVARI